jgi:Fungal specific transcription factor domain
MKALELRLQNIRQESRICAPTESQLQPDRSRSMAELYRLSALIYLEKVAGGAPRASLKANKRTEDAFKILETLRICERPFPLFVIALEARTDNDRATLLKVIARTMEERPLGGTSSVKRMIEAAWAQDDLNLEQELDSLLKYNTIISANRTPPAFT